MLTNVIIFTINTVAPVFIIILIGFILKKTNILDKAFPEVASKIVFNITLPTLVFLKLYNIDLKKVVDFKQLGFCYFGVFSIFCMAWLLSSLFSNNAQNKGVFIQGSFRSNSAIVSLPLVVNAFGSQGLANYAIILTAILPLNNILSIFSLSIAGKQEENVSVLEIILKILKNPIIIGTVLAIIFSVLKIPVNQILVKSGTYLANLTIPLALLSIGATLDFKSPQRGAKLALIAASIKIVVMPLLLTFLAVLVGFTGVTLGSLYFLFAAPTAVSSYVMANAMAGNSKLASSIILLSTVFSVITISLGVFILKTLNLL